MKLGYVAVLPLLAVLSGCVVVIDGAGGKGSVDVHTAFDGSEVTNVARAVRDAYLAEPGLRDADLRVTDRKNGVVRISGRVADAAQAERAIAIAQGTPGVTRVESRLTVGG